MEEVRESELTLLDGRLVAWTECGSRGGRPVLRIPGTPGSRWSMRSDRTPWQERDLWMITIERPGFGRSSPLPGRGFVEHSDDLSVILDHLGIERVHVVGGSGGAPHILSFCERHPSRVAAASVLVGIAPLRRDEFAGMVPHNAQVFSLAAAGDRVGVEEILKPVREALLADPVAALQGLWATAPQEDRTILADPEFLDLFAKGQQEALAQGVQGWVDEDLALAGEWDDIDPSAVGTSITWYHAAGDRNCPLSAAKRLLDQIPNARLVEWPSTVGHLHWFRSEPEILDELLSRGRT